MIDVRRAWLVFPLLVFAACASDDASRRELPKGVDPAGARRLAGDWIFAMKAPEREIDGRLRFSWDGSILTGSFTEIGNDAREISDVRVSRDRLAWSIDGERSRQQFEGAFEPDGTLSGKMTRVRNRDAASEPSDAGEGAPPDSGSGGGYGRGGGRGHHGGGHRSRGGGTSPAKWTAIPAPRDAAPAGPPPPGAGRSSLP